jgi:phage gp29-like protein
VKIPKQRAFYFTNGEEETPFYGVSLFEAAFFHYDKKTKLYYITHLAAQRAAVGTRIGTMPPNPAKGDKENFVRAMRDLGMTQYIVVPSEDWTVESLNESQGASFDFLGLINHHNNQMSKSVLASWFDADAGKGKSESTLVDFGTQNDETFMMMETAIIDDIEASINNNIVPRFIDWNFGSGKYPRLKFGALTEDQQAAIQDIFEKIATAPPGTISEQFIMALEKRMAKICGLEIDYGPIERQRAEDAEMAHKVTRSQQQAQLEQPSSVQAQQGTGQNAGSSAGKTAGAPPPSSGGAGGPGPKPPAPQLSRRDTALVGLIGDVLVDVMQERTGEELDD